MPVLSLSFASTSAKRPPLGVVDHYGSRKGVHPFTGSLTTFNVTGCLVYLFGEAMIMFSIEWDLSKIVKISDISQKAIRVKSVMIDELRGGDQLRPTHVRHEGLQDDDLALADIT